MLKLINPILNSRLPLVLAILCTAFIIYLSLSDISAFPKMNVTHEDKIYHFTAYFVLNFLWLLAFIRKSSKSFSLTILISFGIISFGIIVETIQEVLTDIRVFDYYDILANSTGVALSFMAFEFFKKRIMKI